MYGVGFVAWTNRLWAPIESVHTHARMHIYKSRVVLVLN